MKVFISGGCKNGKSSLAQRLVKELGQGGPIYYVATMIPHDGEDLARIERHRREREGWGFETLECGSGILSVLGRSQTRGVFLLDSVTALLANEMFREDGTIDYTAHLRLADDLLLFADAVGGVVFVSDYIYSDAARFDGLTEAYRRALASIDRALAAHCDAVAELSAAVPYWHKGGAGL